MTNLRQWQQEALELAISRAKFEKAGFHCMRDVDLPKNPHEADAWIKERTRLYRETWLIPLLEAILAGDRESARMLRS